MNIALLVAGMGIGQGAIFAVQTWLVATSRFELLSSFGTHYSVAILGIILVDGGSGTILSRETARVSEEHSGWDELWRIFCETSVFRLSVALLAGIGAVVYTLEFSSDDFSRSYLLFAVPGWLLWACNPSGVLDGLRLSGISGISGAVSYAASALGLVLAQQASPAAAGAILGAAFSVGYAMTVGTQWAALRSLGCRRRLQCVTRAGLAKAFTHGSAMLFQLVPGQINSRVALVLSSAYLGAETTALFTYVKQIVIAAATIIVVVLRVDFPALVHRLSTSEGQTFRGILMAQKAALGCALMLTAGTIVVSLASLMLAPSNFTKVAALLLLFAPTILTASLSMMLTQGLAALAAYVVIAKVATVSTAVGIAVSCLLIGVFGVYALLVGELIIHLIGFYLVLRSLRQLRPARVGRRGRGGSSLLTWRVQR